MKELRAFFELTGLSLLPLLVLFLAVYGPLRQGAAGGTGPETASAATPAPVTDAAVTGAPLPSLPPLPELPAAQEISAGAGEREAPARAAAPGEDAAETAGIPAAEAGETAAAAPEGETAAVFAPTLRDADVTVDILFGSRRETMCLRDYLLGVVAAEMPASFEPAALEAQAVAARTDTLYRLLVAKPHRDAACCTDPGCCKAYLSPEELRRRWGEDYDRWAEKIASAVDATDGEILTWEGAPIFAAFHAASQGRTEDCENVWVAALPYLRSVPTLETEAEVPGFRSTVRFGEEELRSRLLEKVPGAALPQDPEEWFTEVRYCESGRILSVEAGGVTLSGTALRSLLGLRSASVRWNFAEGVFTFETAGYGHGVGLSQYGAEVMAKAGESCEDILLHYYSGAVLSPLGEVFPG